MSKPIREHKIKSIICDDNESLCDCMKGRAMKTDPRYLLVNLYQTIP